MELRRIDADTERPIKLDQTSQETVLGRGPLLKITDSKISRQQAKLLYDESCWNYVSLCARPTYHRTTSSGDWSTVPKGQQVALENGHQFAFLADKYIYQVAIDQCRKEVKGEKSKCAEIEEEPETSKGKKSHSSPTIKTPVKCKERKLPDWMMMMQTNDDNKSEPKDRKTPSKQSRANKTSTPCKRTAAVVVNESSPVKQLSSPDKSDKVASSPIKHKRSDSEEEEEELKKSDVDTKVDLSESEKEEKVDLSGQHELSDSNDEDKAEKKEQVLASTRPSCVFGAGCYRRNPQHKMDEAHPGDDDYKDVNDDEEDNQDQDKPECEYGLECYRQNPQHRKDFKHTARPKRQRKAAGKKGKKQKQDGDDEEDYDSSFINDDTDEDDISSDEEDEEEWVPDDQDD